MAVQIALEELERALPQGRIERGEEIRRAHAHDYWAFEAIHDVGGNPTTPPPAVVFPESTDEVAKILTIANEQRCPVVPFGLGSGVCGGVRPGGEALVVDLSRMARVLEVNDQAATARLQAGLNGAACERLLNERGYTLGHFPQSIAVSSVGGWVATRASGQLSTRYGNIEDLLLALEVVLPGGRVLRTFPAPRAATGPDLRQIFLGSEGTLGIVTEITVKLSPKPEHQDGFAVRLPTWEDGIEVTRELLRAGWRPAILRLYDGVEAQRNFSAWFPDQAPLLLVMSEGTNEMQGALELEIAAARAACLRRGGTDLGREPLDKWLGHRNHVPSWADLLGNGLVVDTIEVAATWDRVGPLHARVTEAIGAVPGVLVASGHTSHAYTTGVNIYFTFVGQATEEAEQERIYTGAWAAAMEATMACGATIAHHHGIGRVRRDYLPRELGEVGIDVLRAVKRAVDPNGIMNPGVLL
ncbi:MAG: FAD-binding oxidoreductase [Deltaproteobacteria bacterium]|nr:FAD-binding oxidoreductase [Deltaproteobacteria bacterium]